jgi:hypothetical protein
MKGSPLFINILPLLTNKDAFLLKKHCLNNATYVRFMLQKKEGIMEATAK